MEVVLFADDFESGTWPAGSGTWGITDPADGHNSANSLNDSPGSNYPDNANTVMEMAASVDLTGAMSGEVSFWAHWEIEDAWDGAFFEVSTNGGGSWTPVATQHTGNAADKAARFPAGAPVFDNNQAGWVLNTVNLSPWLTETDLKFRFRLGSDTSVTNSGFFVDDFEVHGGAPAGYFTGSRSAGPGRVGGRLTESLQPQHAGQIHRPGGGDR